MTVRHTPCVGQAVALAPTITPILALGRHPHSQRIAMVERMFADRAEQQAGAPPPKRSVGGSLLQGLRASLGRSPRPSLDGGGAPSPPPPAPIARSDEFVAHGRGALQRVGSRLDAADAIMATRRRGGGTHLYMGQRVQHGKHGVGTIVAVSPGKRVVRFDVDGKSHSYLPHSFHKLKAVAAEPRRDVLAQIRDGSSLWHALNGRSRTAGVARVQCRP